MQIRVEAVGPQKSSQYGDYFGIKTADGWINLQGIRDVNLKGQTIEIELKDTKSGKWGKLIGKASSQRGEHQNSKHGLNQFEFAEAVNFWFEQIKPFELGDEAKATVLCTLLIATADGRISYELPPDEPETDPFA